MTTFASQVYIQLLLAVHDQSCLLQPEWMPELYENLQEIIEAFDHQVLAINGSIDHVHVFFRWQPDMSIEDLFKKIKTQSTKFVNEQKWLKVKSLWQDAFAAFSYGHSQAEAVVTYLDNQPNYHSKKTFKEECANFFAKFEVEHPAEEPLFQDI